MVGSVTWPCLSSRSESSAAPHAIESKPGIVFKLAVERAQTVPGENRPTAARSGKKSESATLWAPSAGLRASPPVAGSLGLEVVEPGRKSGRIRSQPGREFGQLPCPRSYACPVVIMHQPVAMAVDVNVADFVA